MATSHGNRFAFNATTMGFIWQILKLTLFGFLMAIALFTLPYVKYVIRHEPEFLEIIIEIIVSILVCLIAVGGPIYIGICFCRWFVSKASYGSADNNRLELQYDIALNIKKLIGENLKLFFAVIVLLGVIGAALVVEAFVFAELISRYRYEWLYILIQLIFALLAYMVVMNAMVAIITTLMVDNTVMDGKRFCFNKSSFEYFRVLMIESVKAIIFTPLTLGIYPLFAVLKYLRITAACIEYSGKKVEFDEEFDFWALLVIGIVSGFFSAISFGLLAPWRFVVDTDKILGYAKLK